MNTVTALPQPTHRHRWARRLALVLWQALWVALLVGTLSFWLMRLLPGDAAWRIAASRYGYDLVDAAAAAAVRQELGLDQPGLVALLAWWLDLLQLKLGHSLVSGEPVWLALLHEGGHSLGLAGAALALASLLGLPLGLAAGARPGGWLDRCTLGAAVLLRALPPFVLGLALMLWLAVQWSAVPAAGHGSQGHVLLPALTLALPLAALLCRVTRDAFVAVRQSAYHQFARTKGLSAGWALWRHGLRNLGVPVLATLGVQGVLLVEGVVVVESLFAWPGLGHALVHALFARDVPMVQGAALSLGLLFVLFNATLDLACQALDPRRHTP